MRRALLRHSKLPSPLISGGDRQSFPQVIPMPDKTWLQKLITRGAQINLGEQAVMLEDRVKLLKHNRQSVASAQRKFLGNDMPAPEPDEEDMGVHVGDSTTHNYPAPQRKGMSPLMSGLIGAGLLASGVGIPMAGYFIADAIKNIKPAVVTPGIGDGNTKYRLELLP